MPEKNCHVAQIRLSHQTTTSTYQYTEQAETVHVIGYRCCQLSLSLSLYLSVSLPLILSLSLLHVMFCSRKETNLLWNIIC